MGEELEPKMEFDWNRAKFFYPEYLHDLYQVGTTIGPSLLDLMHELSELTHSLIGMYIGGGEYAEKTIELAKRATELLLKENDGKKVEQAANVLGHAVNSLRDRRFNYDNPGIHPMLRAGLNFGLHQFGRCIQIMLGYKTEGLNLLVNSALYEMDFKRNHPKLEEIIRQGASKEPSLTDVIYSKAPDRNKERFKLRTPKKTKPFLQDAFNTLTKKHVSKETTLEEFQQVFGEKAFGTKVIWAGSMVSLKYFVEELVNHGIVEPPADRAIATINCFFVARLKVKTNDLALIHLKKAAAPKPGSQPEIDKAIQHLR